MLGPCLSASEARCYDVSIGYGGLQFFFFFFFYIRPPCNDEGFVRTGLLLIFFFFFFKKKDHKLSLNQTSQNQLEVHFVTVMEHPSSTLNNH